MLLIKYNKIALDLRNKCKCFKCYLSLSCFNILLPMWRILSTQFQNVLIQFVHTRILEKPSLSTPPFLLKIFKT